MERQHILSTESTVSPLRMSLTFCCVIMLICSNILCVKPVLVFGFIPENAAFGLMIPIYLLSDVFQEAYGYRWSRITATWTMCGTLICSLMFMVGIMYEPRAGWEHQEAMETILGMSPRICFASCTAYWFGDWANDLAFERIKKWTHGKSYFLRAWGSSIVGYYVDQTLFAFIGLTFMPFEDKVKMLAASPIVVLILEALFSPFGKRLAGKLKRQEEKWVL